MLNVPTKIIHVLVKRLKSGTLIYTELDISQVGQYKLQKLCSGCRLTVAKATLKLPEVIDILGKVGKDFTFHLCDHIITQYGRQEINNAKNDGQALYIIRRVSVWFCNQYNIENTSNTG